MAELKVESTVEQIVTRSVARAGMIGGEDGSWSEGLTYLVNMVEHAPAVMPAGRDALYGQFEDALANRFRVEQYRRDHPEVDQQQISRPLFILGMPRTGTTVASYLLDQDPSRRSLLNWEAGDSVPPATSAALRSDPRCLAKKAMLDRMALEVEQAGQGWAHWEDADGPTECMFLHNQDFKALLWDAFMPSRDYFDWVLDADMRPTYAYERSVLQILQSAAPGVWSLKMPSHAVHIEALLEVFPDARLIWSHRDPYRATASLCSVTAGPKRMLLGEGLDPTKLGSWHLDEMRAHIERPAAARRRIGDDRFFDLHYANLVRDPIGEMRRLYMWADDELTPAVEHAMLEWLRRNPQDRFGLRPYALEEYGLTIGEMEPVFAEYIQTYGIELEAPTR